MLIRRRQFQMQVGNVDRIEQQQCSVTVDRQAIVMQLLTGLGRDAEPVAED